MDHRHGISGGTVRESRIITVVQKYCSLSSLLPIVAVGIVALSCAEAWARAGGGGGYGGGGGFSGGGGSGDGGGLFSILIWLCFRHPLIGIPLLLIVVAFFVFGGRKAKSHHVTRTIRRGRQKQADRLLSTGQEAILAHDPAFNMSHLQERVAVAFGKIQIAWSEQKLGSVRPFISDGVHERFSLQIGMQQSEGFRNVMENVRVHQCEPVAIYSTEQFDTIHFRINASADDHKVSLESGRKLPGSGNSGAFTEFWSFHRRPGAKSLSSDGTIEGNCPRCGAPLEVVDVARCESCGAQVNSGEFDWVLAEITQEQEWQVPGAETRLPGVAQLRERDPGFNIQHIEDRVSVMFYRLRAAEFYRDQKYIAPVITPEFRTTIEKSLQESRYYHDPVVGMVELINAETDLARGRDMLHVKLRWSGTLKQRSGESERTLRDQTIYTQVFNLVRDHSAKTTPDETFTSAGCSNCGAPIDVNQEGACVYCGTVLTSGAHDWVLDGIERYTSAMATEHAFSAHADEATSDALFNQPTDAQLPLAVLANVTLLDGRLDDRERRAMHKLGSHRGLSSDRVDQLIEEARSSDGRLPVPSDPRETMAYLEQLAHVILADGQIDRGEKNLLFSYAERTGLSPADVRMTLRRERARAYRHARTELRGKA